MFTTHVTLAFAAVILMGTAVVTAAALRKKRWWLKVHKSLAMAGALLAATTAIVGWFMVQNWQGTHLNGVHGYLGLATVASGVLAIFLGYSQFRYPSRRPALRQAHRAAGFATAGFILVTALWGLSLAGFF